MNFAIPDHLRETLDGMRALVRERVVPLETQAMAGGQVGSISELDAVAEVRALVKERGWWAPQLPADAGGMGLSVLEFGLVSEVLGWSPLGHYCFGCQAPDAGNMEILHKYGTGDHKKRWLAPLAAGEIRSCFSMTEPDRAGSNPTDLDCRAARDGDDYVINGRKWFTTAADGAAFAIVMAVTNPEAPPHARASQIIVPCDTEGFEIVRNIPIMGHAGAGWGSHSEVSYTNVRVPVANRLGGEGAGFLIAQERLGPGRIHHCMRWIGICERSLHLMVHRAATRQLRDGPGGPVMLGDKQIIRAWIAEARAEINAARLAVLHAAWTIDNVGFSAARTEISCIKFYVADIMMRVVDRAIQTHGALGITSDTVLSFFYAHERGARIYDGPDEVHKMVVAKRIFKEHAK
jgi:alkylation response protein AidB-like acyl-CoA dehydrogenase